MPVIDGALIGTSDAVAGRADQVIVLMMRLLEARKKFLVSRRQFLARWHKLRIALFITPEYQAFRNRIIERCGGTCEFCHKAPVDHVHHEERVAMRPDLALTDSNAKGTCAKCHKKQPDHR